MNKNWHQRAVEACAKRDLEVVPCGFEGGYVFVKGQDEKVIPISEHIVAEWIRDDE